MEAALSCTFIVAQAYPSVNVERLGDAPRADIPCFGQSIAPFGLLGTSRLRSRIPIAMPFTPVSLALDALGIAYRLHLHAQPMQSLEQAAEERWLLPTQIVRCLLFRLEDGSFVMVLIAGPEQVSWAKLRRHLGVRRLASASPEEVRRVTGYPPGAVSPLGLPSPLRLLADRSLLDAEAISLGVGLSNAGVILKRDDLLRALNPELGDFRGREGWGT